MKKLNPAFIGLMQGLNQAIENIEGISTHNRSNLLKTTDLRQIKKKTYPKTEKIV